MIKVRAEVKDNDVVKIDFECEGNSYNIMQELICIIGHAMTEMEPVEGATVEDLVRDLPEAVIESMRLNGVLEGPEVKEDAKNAEHERHEFSVEG